MQTIICMKWGSRYGPEFVNRLNKSIQKHTKRPTQLICFTDEQKGIDEQIKCYPLPNINLPETISKTPWRKLSVWQFPLENLTGDVLFLDLDIVITGNLDQFFDYKPGNIVLLKTGHKLDKILEIRVVLDFQLENILLFLKKFQKEP